MNNTANDNSAAAPVTTYAIIGVPFDGGTVDLFAASVEELSALVHQFGCKQIGVTRQFSTPIRPELLGLPRFSGLAGPMYGGPGVVRYEMPAAYKAASL